MELYVRAGNTEQIPFVLKQNGAAFNLSTATSVTLRRSTDHGVTDHIDTVNNPTELAISNAAGGEVTLSPAADYWDEDVLTYEMYFDVLLGGRIYTFPSPDDESADTIIVTVARSFS